METTFVSSIETQKIICLFVQDNKISTEKPLDLSFSVPAFKKSILLQIEDSQYLLIERKEKDTALSLGGKIISAISAHELENAVIVPPKTDQMEDFFLGMELGAYRFHHYFSEPKNKAPKAVQILGDEALEEIFEKSKPLSEGVNFSRDLISEPSNTLTPNEFKERIVNTLEPLGMKVTVLDEKAILDNKMMALHGVARGSRKPPFVVVMHWEGDSNQPIAFAGKGVCFDTGGISIKPSARMHEMKYDMGGAGIVTGLMYALAKRKAKANVIGIVGLVENMPDGDAQNPGDVVTSMSGQTIEVINTDAEGRLVLADVLTYLQKEYKPQAIVDLATLTGAMVVALGRYHAGVFSNNDDLSEKLLASGVKTEEKLWRMPIGDDYDQDINSDIADMQNVGKGGAGSITAAQFIGRFIENDTPWAHLDIAGVTWASTPNAYTPKGASGFGVRLLNDLIANHYETT